MINNCDSYKFEKGELLCSTCATGFFITDDYRECIEEVLSNCLIYKKVVGNQFLCAECKSEFVLINNVCKKGEIQGCLTYNNRENCITCDTGKIATRI